MFLNGNRQIERIILHCNYNHPNMAHYYIDSKLKEG